MHIVALNGSPHRKGNTATLMQWVLDGCEEVVRPLVEGNLEAYRFISRLILRLTFFVGGRL